MVIFITNVNFIRNFKRKRRRRNEKELRAGINIYENLISMKALERSDVWEREHDFLTGH